LFTNHTEKKNVYKEGSVLPLDDKWKTQLFVYQIINHVLAIISTCAYSFCPFPFEVTGSITIKLIIFKDQN
jgi:hypothetical protein